MSPPETHDELSGVICCRWCRETARNELLFSQNHGTEFATHWGCCLAQSLTRNHVLYYVERLTLGATVPADRRTGLHLRHIESRGWVFADGTPVDRTNSRHVDYQAKRRLGPDARESDRQQLARCIERAAELWAHMDATEWLDHARTVYADTAPLEAPDHRAVQAADQGGLW